MMTCIYDAWCGALELGHENIHVQIEGENSQFSLCDEYIHVDYDEEKTKKVIRSIKNKISDTAFRNVYYATLAEDDELQTIYDFLRIGFKVGDKVCFMYTEPVVRRMMEINRKVGNEAHSFVEFCRFNSIDNKVYVSHIEPKSNVVWLVAQHFEDRMPSEHWMIIDDKRKIAVVHPKDSESYMRILTEEEFQTMQETEKINDEYTEQWKTFFESVSIKQRENKQCQRNFFPIWKRKHAVEFE